MKRQNLICSFAGGLIAAAMFVSSASAEVITLRSGNGTIGGTDSDISMLIGPVDTYFGSAFTATDFANARSGPQAFIIGNHPAWLPASSFSDPSARYISTNALASHPTPGIGDGASALFAIDFTITDASIASASISFDFAVDNLLGDNDALLDINEGLFLNGTALSGSTTGGGFDTTYNFTRTDIAPLLVTGLNTLYINMTDVGGPSGLIFSTVITTVAGDETPVPEPGMVALFGLGLIGLGLARRRKKKS